MKPSKAKDTPGAEPPVPASPEQREEPAELAALGEGPVRAGDSTEKLIEKMAAFLPFLPALLAAATLAERVAIVEQSVPPAKLGNVILQLTTIIFFYEAKDKKIAEALQLAELQYELAKRMPEDSSSGDDASFSRTRHLADALQSMASKYHQLGSTAKALENYREAEKYFVQDQNERSARGLPVMSEWDRVFNGRAGIALFYENFGRLQHDLGDEAAARECWGNMRRYDSGNLTAEAKFQRAISSGIGAEHEGDMDAALGAYQSALDEALAMARGTMVTRDPATACHHIGEAMARLGLYRRALWYHGQARQLNAKSGHLERLHYDYAAIGRIYRKRPRYGDALAEFEAALKCVSGEGSSADLFAWAAGGAVYRVLNPDLAWEPALEIGRLYRERGSYEDAARFLQLSIDLSEAARSSVVADQHRIGVQGERSGAYQEMVSLHATLAASSTGEEQARHSRLTFEYAERSRGRAFLDSLGDSPIAVPEGVPEELRGSEAALLEQLRGLRARASGNSAVWDEYAGTREELDRVWERIGACGAAAAEYVAMRRGQPLEWAGLGRITAPQEGARRVVLAEYFDAGDRFLLLLAAPGDAHPRVIPLSLDRKAVAEAVRQHLHVGGGEPWQGIDVPGLQKTLAPLLDAVVAESSRGDLLWFVPHGELHRVPLHAFDAGGEPLLERNPVCYSPSASVMKYCRTNRHASRTSALLLADSRPDMALPYAREQVDVIRRDFATSSVLAGAEATRSRLDQSLTSGSGFDVLHLACHGVFRSDDPLASGILLAPEGGRDAVWTARDILALRLPADLVTLSACESGLSESLPGEELLGLTRAFLYAGASTVAVTNWSVNEISTSILMAFFYEEMAAGADKAEALRRAARRLRGMTAEQAIGYCRDAAQRNPEAATLLEEDIAGFEFQARDFAAALRRYTVIRQGLEPGSPALRRISVSMSRCRLALKTASQPDYSTQPFGHPYHWAPFALVGSWS